MKTAQSIEEQSERKNARGDADSSRATTPPVRVKMKKLDAQSNRAVEMAAGAKWESDGEAEIRFGR